MDNVTRFPGTQAKPQAQLTSAHRFLIYSIFDLCTHISEQTAYKASCDYSGSTHALSVDIVPPEHLGKGKGGNGSFSACWSARLNLPPHDLAPPDSLQALGNIIATLQGYLPTTGGAA